MSTSDKKFEVKSNRRSLKIALLYLFFGVIWISVSDTLLFSIVQDSELLSRLQSYKGWFFILITTILLYYFLKREFNILADNRIALQQSEDRYRKLVENMPEVVGVEQNGLLKYINPEGLRIFGYDSLNEIEGKPNELFIHESSIEKINSMIFNEPNVVIDKPIELKCVRKDGTVFLVESQYFPTVYKGAHAVQFIFRDITEIKEKENELKQNQMKYSTVFNESNDGIVLIDSMDGSILECNKAFKNMLGKEYEQLLLMKIWEIRPQNDQAAGKKYFEKIGDNGFGKISNVTIETNYSAIRYMDIVSKVLFLENKKIIYSILRDVTDTKTAQEALIKSEKQFRQIIETAGEGIWIIDNETRTTFVNRKMCLMLGYSCGEILGESLFHFIDPEWSKNSELNIDKTKKHVSKQHEIKFTTKKGDELWALLNTSPLISEEGEYIGLLAMVSDITARKSIEQALLLSELKFRAVVEQSITGIYIFDEKYFLYVNQRLCDIFGYSSKELLFHMGPLELISVGDRETVIENIKKRIEGKVQSLHYIARGLRKDNSFIWVEIHGSRMILDGKPVITGTLLDITERKKNEEVILNSEAKFRAVVEQSITGIYVFDENGFLYANNHFCEMLGYSEEEVLTELQPLDIIAEVDREMVETQIQDRFTGKTKSAHYIVRGVRKDGSILWVELHSKLILYNGKPAITGTVLNISERKIAELERDKLIEELSILKLEAETSRDQLANVFDRMNDGIVALDKDWNYIYVNNKAAKFLQREKPEDLIGKHIWTEYPEGIDQPFYKAYIRAMETQESAYYVDHYQPWDRWFENRIYPSPEGLTIYFTEISERKRAEELAKESERRFRVMLETVNLVSVILDESGMITFCNDYFLKLTGYNLDEVLNKNWFNLFIPEDILDEIKQVFFTNLPFGKIPSHYENSILSKNGDKILISWTNTILKDINKNILGVASIGEDITLRRKIEEALHNSETRFRSLTENLPDMIAQLDENNRILYVNPTMITTLGIVQDNIIGKTIEQLDLKFDEIENWNNILRNVMESGKEYQFEYKFLVNNEEHFFESRLVPELNDEGDYDTILMISRDITFRKKAEEVIKEREKLLSVIYNNVSDVLFLLSVEPGDKYKFISVNKLFYESTGLNQKQIIGKDIRDVIPESTHSLVLKNYRQAIDTGKTTTWEEVTNYPSGLKYGLVSVAPIFNENNICTNLVGTVHDITDLREIDLKIRKSEQRLRIALKETNIGLWDWDLDKDVWFATPVYFTMLGYEPISELQKGELLGQYLHPQDQELVMNKLYEIKSRKSRGFDLEFRLQHSDGSYRWINCIARAIESFDNEQLIRVIGLQIDITNRKEAEEKLEQSELLLKEMGKIAKIGGWEFDVKTMEGTWTEEVALIHEMDPSEETNVELALGFYEPKSRKIIERAIQEAIEFGKPYDVELQMISKKGIVKWVRSIGTPVLENNKTIKVRGSFQDITFRKIAMEAIKSSEEKLRALFESDIIGTVTADIYGNIDSANDEFLRIIGYGREDLINGKLRWDNITPVEWFEADKEGIAEAQEKGSCSPYEKQYIKKDGSLVWILIGFVLFGKNREKAIAFVLDLTPIKEKENELQESRDQLRRLHNSIETSREEERSAIAREIHDEIGQVLSSLKMNFVLISKQYLGAKTINKKKLETEIKSMMNILDTTVIQMRKLISTLRPDVLDKLGLIPALEYQYDEFSKTFAGNCLFNNKVGSIKLEGKSEITIFRIFQEALTNINKHAEAKNVVIELKKSSKKLVLSIQDDGKGFNNNEMELRNSFGLVGMKERAQMINSNLKIISKKGGGSKITLSIPF
jgi:PAS domain S-box-containing protein